MSGLYLDTSGLALTAGGLWVTTGLGGATLLEGVPEFIVQNGVLLRLLIGYDGQPLTGYDGQYLYGRAA